jgi:hypothetical protein
MNIVVKILIGMIVLLPFFWVLPTYAEDVSSAIFALHSRPYGTDYAIWTVKWWQWFIAIPEDKTPADDPTGERCGTNQDDPDVWFLTGAFEGTVERNCTIPFGRAIFLPVVASECSYAEYANLKTEAELRKCAVEGDEVTDLGASFDGLKVQNIRDFRIQSPIFNASFPEKNVFGARVGPTQSVSDFYGMFLKPPSIGKHELHFFVLTLENPATGVPASGYDVTYHITVKQANFSELTENCIIEDKTYPIIFNSSSSISNFSCNKEAERISFKASENNVQGITEVPVGSIISGPYVVMMDGNPIKNFKTVTANDTKMTSIMLAYAPGNHEIVITGSNFIPEFSVQSAIVLALSVCSLIGIMNLARHRRLY